MGISVIENFFKETITRSVSLTGATSIYLSALPTPDEGYVVISPSSSTLREIVYYTAKGTDGNGTYITVTLANRGLGGTIAQTHAIGEPVRMNVTAEHIKEISDALDEIVAGGAQDASAITKGITKLSVAPASANEPIAVGDNDPRVLSNPASIKFGGTGADGALAITSGATDIDLGGAAIVIKNYTSISITGTASLTFTNPHANGTIIILKSQGNVTLTSSANPTIDLRSLGATGGTGTSQQGGTAGSDGFCLVGKSGGGGQGGKGSTAALAAVNAIVGKSPLATSPTILTKVLAVGVGAGGGAGGGSSTSEYICGGAGGSSLVANGGAIASCNNTGNGTGAGGAGGRGGGSLYIECGGNLNKTSIINAAGSNGSNQSGGDGKAGGGGGGGGGSVVILYDGTLTANTGAITVTGGTAGSGSNGANGGAGADGYSLVAQNTEFI